MIRTRPTFEDVLRRLHRKSTNSRHKLRISQVTIMADTAPEMVDTVPAETAVENEDDAERTTKMETGDFSDEDLSSFERPRNMFDITEMTYDDYVEKHYEIMGKNMKEKLVHQQMMQMQMMMKQQMGGMGGMGAGGYGGFGTGASGMGFGQGGGVGMGFGQGGGNRFGSSVPPGARPPPGYCNTFFAGGQCRFGENCRYKHEMPPPGAVPLPGQGGAPAGTAGAPAAGFAAGALPARDPNKPAGYCNAFQKGECKFGDQCRYRHRTQQRTNPHVQPAPGGSTGAFAAAGYGGF
jgi:hypothetical protein